MEVKKPTHTLVATLRGFETTRIFSLPRSQSMYLGMLLKDIKIIIIHPITVWNPADGLDEGIKRGFMKKSTSER